MDATHCDGNAKREAPNRPAEITDDGQSNFLERAMRKSAESRSWTSVRASEGVLVRDLATEFVAALSALRKRTP